MADTNPENEPTIVERWLEDQQQWQRTVLAYLDSMTKNDDFLVTSATPCGARSWRASPTRPRRLRPRLARVPAPAPEVETCLTNDWTRCFSRCTSCKGRSRTCK